MISSKSASSSSAGRQESHRIHWQQWAGKGESKRELITTSAALRLSDGAKARDVTKVLAQSLNLTSGNADALVLVGTLFHHAPIVFEHEQPYEAAHHNKKEPLNIVRTLQPDESPLVVRDDMLTYLKQTEKDQESSANKNSVIAPKLQWFYVPSDLLSNIPNCIALDGYCTDMDDNDDASDSQSDGEEKETADVDMPWRSSPPESPPTSSSRHRTQIRRCQQLAHYRCTTDHHCFSGYLLKQSRKDPHVWKRVHCVLTEDFLWYITRVKDTPEGTHSRIRLTRALLLDDYTALQRIPHALEVVSEQGVSHVFRASTRPLQLRWIQCLADRIVQCHENSILDHAELICQDEATARNVRSTTRCCSTKPELFRWALEVSEYKEMCRHIATRLGCTTPSRIQKSSSLASPSSSYSAQAQVDSAVRDIIVYVWDMASLLLAKVLSFSADKGQNVDTLCRHIDYVLTGRFRTLQDGVSSTIHDRSRDAPPSDLFDNLLVELQTTRVAENSQDLSSEIEG
jgi:hypothetical protein